MNECECEILEHEVDLLKSKLIDLRHRYAELQRELYIIKQARDTALKALPDCDNNDCDSYGHGDNCAVNSCPIKSLQHALKEAITLMEFHANINNKIATILNQDFDKSWLNDLTKKITLLEASQSDPIVFKKSEIIKNVLLTRSRQLKQEYEDSNK